MTEEEKIQTQKERPREDRGRDGSVMYQKEHLEPPEAVRGNEGPHEPLAGVSLRQPPDVKLLASEHVRR